MNDGSWHELAYQIEIMNGRFRAFSDIFQMAQICHVVGKSKNSHFQSSFNP